MLCASRCSVRILLALPKTLDAGSLFCCSSDSADYRQHHLFALEADTMPAGWPALGTVVVDVVFTAAAMNAVYEYGVQRYNAPSSPRRWTMRLAMPPSAGDSRSASH
eukprot:jgi/Tetstr1/448372/TSEL_035654.t1